MEMDLTNIIAKIKEEGVGEAEKEAGNITEKAREEAARIVAEASRKKEEIIRDAEKDAERLRKNGEDAVKQASRDVLLGLREQIVSLFDSIVKKEVSSDLSKDVIKKMMGLLVENFKIEEDTEVEILLNDKDKQELEQFFLAELKETMKKGVTLKASPNIENGFRIGEKGQNSFYDFTDEAIAEAFRSFLNPKIMKILQPNK